MCTMVNHACFDLPMHTLQHNKSTNKCSILLDRGIHSSNGMYSLSFVSIACAVEPGTGLGVHMLYWDSHVKCKMGVFGQAYFKC